MYFVKPLLFTESFPKLSERVRENSRNFHCVCVSQCGNSRNSLWHFFRKHFVKAKVWLKKLLNSWFDDFICEREFLVFPHCVCYYGEKFRENITSLAPKAPQYFSMLIWEKFRENVSFLGPKVPQFIDRMLVCHYVRIYMHKIGIHLLYVLHLFCCHMIWRRKNVPLVTFVCLAYSTIIVKFTYYFDLSSRKKFGK